MRPPPWSWPAARTIAQVRPTSASTTAATSCGGAPRLTCSRDCSRLSWSAGWRSASSKAAARTRPRPSPRAPFGVPRDDVATVAMTYSSARPDRWFSAGVALPGTVAGLVGEACQRPLDPLDRALLAEHGKRLEDPRRDRGTGDRHADRLIELPRLHV